MRAISRAAAAAFLALTAAAFTAQAAPPLPIEQRLSAEQLHATGLDTLSPAQLALLNRLLQEESAQAAATAAAAAPAPAAPAVIDPTAFAGAQDGPLKARLVGELAGWAPGTVFVLENGQHWQVLKGELTLPKVLQSPQVVLVPGAMGRWFLQVDEDLPKARVQRIR